MNDSEFQKALDEIINAYIYQAREDLRDRLRQWPPDLTARNVHEVVGALLARQVTLASSLASCSGNWDGNSAPLFLRAMADVYINLAWVLIDPSVRAEKFILFGLGQAKLEIEHRKAELETRDAEEGELEYVEAVENWINNQRATFLTEVNLGSWSGASTRTMAEEAGCIDFYNYVYTPFSSCVHSTWNHIARYNLKPCSNPLHQFHSVPEVAYMQLDPFYVHLGARYLHKTFVKFDEVFGTNFQGESALEGLTVGLNSLSNVIVEDAGNPAPT